MEKAVDFIKNNKFNILLLLVYIFALLCVVPLHELWRDETQAWCIARDLNLFDAYNMARVEGHPMLWYLILMPFAKLGCDVFVMQIISALLVFLAVFFLLFKSQFNNFIKTITIFSVGMLYYLPIVARNYALIPLFLFLLAHLYKTRKQHPILYAVLIILLANTHILMLGFACILSILFLIDLFKEENKKPFVFSFLLLALNFIFLFFSFYTVQGLNHAVVNYSQSQISIIEALKQYAQLFFLQPKKIMLDVVIFYSLLITAFISFYRENKRIFIILMASFLYHFFVYYKVWFNGVSYQKSFLLLLVMIFCYWIIENKAKLLTYSICILLLISSIFSSPVIMLEIKHQYSANKEMAEYIKENLKDEKEIGVISYPFLISGLSAYLPDKKLYSFINKYYITYYDFNSKKVKYAQDEPNVDYFIVHSHFDMNDDFEEVFKTTEEIINTGEYPETFSLYKRKKL